MPVSGNPHHPAQLPTGWTADVLDALPTADLVEHLRFLDHEMRHHPTARGRWWRSKHLAEGRRALVRRGLSPDAWQTAGGGR